MGGLLLHAVLVERTVQESSSNLSRISRILISLSREFHLV